MVSRNICWTLNNWTEPEEEALLIIAPIKYICWGREIGDEGTRHLQGYAEFSKPMRWAGIKKMGAPWDRMHLEARRGTQDEAIAYTGKDGLWKEIGTKAKAGNRSDLDRARVLASEEGMRAVTLQCSMQQIRVAEKFLTYHEEPRDWECRVEWIWGPSGAGKSRLARERTASEDTFVKNDSSKWWDGYDGHQTVILDDFRDSWWSLTETLSLLDRYEKRIEIKGGWRQFKPSRIIVTTVNPPECHYRGTGESQEQLLRRIADVTELRNEDGGVILGPPVLTEDDLKEVIDELNGCVDLGVKPVV